MWCNTLRFSKCLQVNRDRNLVVVTTNTLEKYLLDEADVASYTNIFSSQLCKAKPAVNSQFSSLQTLFQLTRYKTTTTDFKTCRKQCTQRLTNPSSRLSYCSNHCTCWCLRKAYVVNCKGSVYAQ